MTSRSSDLLAALPLPLDSTQPLEEWVSARWPEMSPQKRRLLEERYQSLWSVLDETTRAQMSPSQVKEQKTAKSRNLGIREQTHPPHDLTHVDLLTGAEFEKFVGKVFERKGYTVEYHGGPTEAGGDLVCWEGSTERVHAILVQVKRERSLTGTQAIGQIIRKENWFRHRYPNATYEKWVITSSHFSRQARKEAEDGRIILMDRDVLEDWLAEEK